MVTMEHKIKLSSDGYPFSEVRFIVKDGAVPRFYLSRFPYVLSPTVLQHEYEGFEKRRQSAKPDLNTV